MTQNRLPENQPAQKTMVIVRSGPVTVAPLAGTAAILARA
jgi:hypothetical protein